MRRIHVARNRQPLGHFSPEEVATGLRSGRFMPGDLAWSEPMESWKPLSEFTDLPVSPALFEPSVPPTPPAWSEMHAAPVLAEATMPEPAWERRQEIGLVAALVATVKAILSLPVTTFRNFRTEGNIANPVFFYCIVGTLTGWVSMAYQFGITMVNPKMAMGAAAQELTAAQFTVVFGLMFFMLPAIVAIIPFVASGILHLVLMILGAANKPYEATLRVFCYGWGVALIFQLIPICGSYLTLVLGMVLLSIGFKEVHRTDYVRSISAVAAPLLLCCGVIFATVASLTAAAAGLK